MKLLLPVFILLFISAHAQKFNWETNLEKAGKAQFYRIPLSSEILSKLNADFSDIRIFDKNNEEVPYLLTNEVAVTAATIFKEYEIVKKTYNRAAGYTRLVFKNPKKSEISNIILVIKNADVKKWLRLNASDDNKNWFALKDKYYFESFAGEENTHEIRILNFPLSNYMYYELLVSDFVNEPINILKAGYLDVSIEKGLYSETQKPVFNQEDKKSEKRSEKQSLVKISFPESVYLDKISLEFDYPTFFRRDIHFELIDSAREKRKKYGNFNEIISTGIVSSNSMNSFYFNRIKVKDFYLVIFNNDDKPLKIKDIKAEHLNSYLTAKIKPENDYVLRFGNKELQAPVYDLAYFQDSIPKNSVFLKSGKIIKLEAGSDKSKRIDKSKTVVIWVALIVVLGFLAFMTSKMLRDMKNKT